VIVNLFPVGDHLSSSCRDATMTGRRRCKRHSSNHRCHF